MELLWENISDVQASVQYSMITGLAHCIEYVCSKNVKPKVENIWSLFRGVPMKLTTKEIQIILRSGGPPKRRAGPSQIRPHNMAVCRRCRHRVLF